MIARCLQQTWHMMMMMIYINQWLLSKRFSWKNNKGECQVIFSHANYSWDMCYEKLISNLKSLRIHSCQLNGSFAEFPPFVSNMTNHYMVSTIIIGKSNKTNILGPYTDKKQIELFDHICWIESREIKLCVSILERFFFPLKTYSLWHWQLCIRIISPDTGKGFAGLLCSPSESDSCFKRSLVVSFVWSNIPLPKNASCRSKKKKRRKKDWIIV